MINETGRNEYFGKIVGLEGRGRKITKSLLIAAYGAATIVVNQ
jgi:hypothetical protein